MEENATHPESDMGGNRPRPISELEGSGLGGYGYHTSTNSGWHSPAPAYTTNEPKASPLMGRGGLHEMG